MFYGVFQPISLKVLSSCLWQDGEDEDINFVNDGSGLDEATKQFDRIVGALEGWFHIVAENHSAQPASSYDR